VPLEINVGSELDAIHSVFRQLLGADVTGDGFNVAGGIHAGEDIGPINLGQLCTRTHLTEVGVTLTDDIWFLAMLFPLIH
jgi:hypothetical protein